MLCRSARCSAKRDGATQSSSGSAELSATRWYMRISFRSGSGTGRGGTGRLVANRRINRRAPTNLTIRQRPPTDDLSLVGGGGSALGRSESGRLLRREIVRRGRAGSGEPARPPRSVLRDHGAGGGRVRRRVGAR